VQKILLMLSEKESPGQRAILFRLSRYGNVMDIESIVLMQLIVRE
jgi:hypothetical protein